MRQILNKQALETETLAFLGSGGVSAEGRRFGFRPAFLDTETEIVYLSRYADGRPASVHLLEGLPDGLAMSWSATGRVASVKPSMVAGFSRGGQFFTRGEVAKLLRQAGSEDQDSLHDEEQETLSVNTFAVDEEEYALSMAGQISDADPFP